MAVSRRTLTYFLPCFSNNRDSGYGSWRSDRSERQDPEMMSPGVMSNNRRWMLYRMTKQSTDDLLEVKPPSGEQPTVTENLSSRIDKLNDPAQPEPKSLVVPGKLDAGSGLPPTQDSPATPVGAQNGEMVASNSNVASLRDKLANSRVAKTMGTSQTSVATTSSTVVSPPDIDSRWDGIEKSARKRALRIKDIDFTDLKDIDDVNVLQALPVQQYDGVPPPPPAMGAPPLPPHMMGAIPPPPKMVAPLPPGAAPAPPKLGLKKTDNSDSPTKPKKTLRLYWKEAHAKIVTPNPTPDIKNQGSIWSTIKPAAIDIQKFGHLFETRVIDQKAKV